MNLLISRRLPDSVMAVAEARFDVTTRPTTAPMDHAECVAALRDHDIAAQEGIFWRKATLLPFARIQHVETSSGPVERSRGLARLKLFTAGGMTSDLDIIGLDAGTADTLREHLAEQIRLRDALAGKEPENANNADDVGGAEATRESAEADVPHQP